MHFKIIVSNGHFPLEYRCSTAHEAYGCMETLSTGLLHDIPIDMDRTMEELVSMKNGGLPRIENHRYSISCEDGEV